jgi:DNA-binding response OmpR family regulator
MAVPVPRIILMDDDNGVLTAVGRLLTSMRMDVTPVATCTGAYFAAAHVRSDLLIADQVLPDGDGVACAAELKARYGFATLVYSAQVRPAGTVEGIDAWVNKPGDAGGTRQRRSTIADEPGRHRPLF